MDTCSTCFLYAYLWQSMLFYIVLVYQGVICWFFFLHVAFLHWLWYVILVRKMDVSPGERLCYWEEKLCYSRQVRGLTEGSLGNRFLGRETLCLVSLGALLRLTRKELAGRLVGPLQARMPCFAGNVSVPCFRHKMKIVISIDTRLETLERWYNVLSFTK